MSKRKRLNPAALPSDGPLETKAINGWVGVNPPPIANISGDASVRAALDEVTAELTQARATGRMITQLPLDAVDEAHLVRDRVAVDADEMATLTDSLRARGQQTPVEVVDLGAGRYGLISGWRRLMALRDLHAQTSDPQFAKVAAVIRSPDGAADAYLSMVEENEVRTNLSFYERARIAVKASEQGIYATPKAAIQSLFSATRPAKRSKILNFTVLVEALDDRLRFPADISEKLGLALVAKLQTSPAAQRQLSEALRKAAPADAKAERRVLERVLKGAQAGPKPGKREELLPGLTLHSQARKVTLSGAVIDDALLVDLREWLLSRAK